MYFLTALTFILHLHKYPPSLHKLTKTDFEHDLEITCKTEKKSTGGGGKESLLGYKQVGY